MKKLYGIGLVAGVIAGLVFLLGCEWTTNTDSFNTSQGAGANINFSGVYFGKLAGGRAVSGTSGAPISRLVLQHAGSAVKVLDNNGSTYEGSIGSPGVIAPASGGVYPVGATLAQGQINFSGVDIIAGKKVNFAGVIHAVAVDDVRGESEIQITTESVEDNQYRTDEASQSRENNYTWTSNMTFSTAGTSTVTTLHIIAYDENGNIAYESITTTTTTPNGNVLTESRVIKDNRSSSTNSSRERGREYSDGRQQVESTKYYITEANTQYRLQGTWIEEGGVNASVDALSPATSGLITTVSPGTPVNDSGEGATEGTDETEWAGDGATGIPGVPQSNEGGQTTTTTTTQQQTVPTTP